MDSSKAKLSWMNNITGWIFSSISVVNNLLNRFNILMAQLALASAMAIGIAQVFARYLFQSSLMWSEESMRYLLIWLVFNVVPIAVKEGKHVILNIIVIILRPAIRKYINICTDIFCILFLGFLSINGIKLLSAMRFQRASSFPVIHLKYIYAIVPICLGIAVFQFVESIIKELVGKEDRLK